MKVIQVPFCFHPDAMGGTEVYVESLVRHLPRHGVKGLIAAPAAEASCYAHDGIRVRRFAVSPALRNLRDLYGAGDIRAARAFATILDIEQPDLVHLHAFTAGVSLRMAQEIKRRGIGAVFTYHTPAVSCPRGTLLRWGCEVCEGLLDVHACAGCVLHGLGLNKMGSRLLGGLPPAIGRLAGAAGLSGDVGTALRMTELIQLRHASLRALLREVDQVVAVSQWVKDLLQRNGVSPDKITLSRHGLPHPPPPGGRGVGALPPDPVPLRVVYLGRLDPSKGLAVLIRALRRLSGSRIELAIYGIVQDASAHAHLQQLKALAGGDPRIRFLPPVPGDRIIPLLRDYHVLAVPSCTLETGPLVVLEAFAAGIPVLGSRLGGIAELVEHNVNGQLVEPGSVAAWRRALATLAVDNSLRMRLRAGVRPPRGMDEVAKEMAALYRSVRQEQASVRSYHALG